ncbi:MAG: hypothetical protein IPK99_12540 [Flavobacteriales bacterium]|nr:hypothetical protein [Flavobacteriales bacterium]
MADTYTVTVTDAGCVSTGSITITGPAAFTASIGYTNPSCPGAPCNGSASANLSGAQGTVAYVWTSNGSTVGGNSANVSNLCGGPLTLTATDANGCIATANATISAVTCGPVINNCGNLNNISRTTGSLSVGAISGALYYQFQFNTPCGYNRNNTTSAGSTVITLNWATLPLEDCQIYGVRARAFMDLPAPTPDDYGPWGDWCTMTMNGCATPMQLKPAHVWSPNLTPTTGFVEVNKRVDAYRYQFEFWSVDANDAPMSLVKTVSPVAQGQTGYVYQSNRANLNLAPQLSACTKYKVRVRRSQDCTTNWEGTWGPYVLIKTNGTCPPGMVVQPGNGLAGAMFAQA